MQITARVQGAVDKVAFVEGQVVKEGDPLVVIEVDRFQVAVDQAKAALDKTVAAHKAAQAELARRQGAVAAHPGLVPGEEIDQYATSVTSTQADSDAAQQALRRVAGGVAFRCVQNRILRVWHRPGAFQQGAQQSPAPIGRIDQPARNFIRNTFQRKRRFIRRELSNIVIVEMERVRDQAVDC